MAVFSSFVSKKTKKKKRNVEQEQHDNHVEYRNHFHFIDQGNSRKTLLQNSCMLVITNYSCFYLRWSLQTIFISIHTYSFLLEKVYIFIFYLLYTNF